mmetsp:Transcript_6816/g.16751  ORF Transcript_6816/g.16751 Transcript_6816/m.16751 type:complete len:525 (+) Transcript_6816:442-2016(+)
MRLGSASEPRRSGRHYLNCFTVSCGFTPTSLTSTGVSSASRVEGRLAQERSAKRIFFREDQEEEDNQASANVTPDATPSLAPSSDPADLREGFSLDGPVPEDKKLPVELMRRKSYIRKMRKRMWLSIEDPFEKFRILGATAKGQERLSKEFKRAVQVMWDAQGLQREGQRERFRDLFERATSQNKKQARHSHPLRELVAFAQNRASHHGDHGARRDEIDAYLRPEGGGPRSPVAIPAGPRSPDHSRTPVPKAPPQAFINHLTAAREALWSESRLGDSSKQILVKLYSILELERAAQQRAVQQQAAAAALLQYQMHQRQQQSPMQQRQQQSPVAIRQSPPPMPAIGRSPATKPGHQEHLVQASLRIIGEGWVSMDWVLDQLQSRNPAVQYDGLLATLQDRPDKFTCRFVGDHVQVRRVVTGSDVPPRGPAPEPQRHAAKAGLHNRHQATHSAPRGGHQDQRRSSQASQDWYDPDYNRNWDGPGGRSWGGPSGKRSGGGGGKGYSGHGGGKGWSGYAPRQPKGKGW